jgi:hypothetical protein
LENLLNEKAKHKKWEDRERIGFKRDKNNTRIYATIRRFPFTRVPTISLPETGREFVSLTALAPSGHIKP